MKHMESSEKDTRDSNDIYLLLVTANVLRLRGQYDLAEAKCSEALRRQPDDAGPYSLLGDISRDRGNFRDAIEWYKAALDRAPGNLSDRRKMEEAIDQVYAAERGTTGARYWRAIAARLRAMTAELRGARLPFSVVLPLGALVGVIVVISVVVLAIGRAEPPVRNAVTETPSGAFVGGKPEVTAEAAGGDLLAGGEVPARDPAFEQDVASLEAALLADLREVAPAVDADCQVLEVEIDPVTGTVSLWLSAVRFWSPEYTRERIRKAALPLAVRAAAADARITAVRVRCEMRERGQPDRVALVAEADVPSLLRAAEGPTMPAQNVFSRMWWHPDLRPASGDVGPSRGE